MKKWFNYVLAVITSFLVYSFAYSQYASFLAGGAFLMIIGMIFSFDRIRNRVKVESLVFSLIGFYIAIAAFGMAFPFLSKFPSYISWGILGVFTTASVYSFYLYQKEREMISQAQRKHTTSSPALDSVEESSSEGGKIPKILDTSVIIDGRIIDIVGTGFVEGPFIVPNFVLREIQLISDSSDSLKRSRGRRGLDMLNEFQSKKGYEVSISYKDYSNTREVDAKLIHIAKEMNAKLITNDFNLNKIAELQDIIVLNINNLANVLKPVALPGEEMEIQVVKEGKDKNQGIGYLNDGTMVVVENGRALLHKRVCVNVTSVIQTNAGKMIFTKVTEKNMAKKS